MESYILALDQGTTSSRAILFDRSGRAISASQKPFTQSHPKPGWVEHDPEEIWSTQLSAAREAISSARITPSQVAGIGIANQRETAVFWDRKTGHPLGPAIVWQDRRTTDICRRLSAEGLEKKVAERTGLLLDPYFSAPKIMWFLQAEENHRSRAQSGEICFGTVDSWLIRRLTGRHLTDPSNASRTMLFDIGRGAWDPELASAMGVPLSMLAQVCPSASDFGTVPKEILGAAIPVRGVLGDQQAALLGQACLEPGDVKVTYGTGCFCLLCTGRERVASANRLLTTVAWDLGEGLEYALEGSVFIGGAVVQWLRDELRILSSAAESETMARSVSDTGGVYFVPAFVGLGAPYWDPDARGSILGITRGTRQEHIVRAGLESVALQTRDLVEAMERDAGSSIRSVRVDGGASTNAFLMQFQADILGVPLVRPRTFETTALGAAFAAGLSAGMWDSRKQLSSIWQADAIFEPSMSEVTRGALVEGWSAAVRAARAFGRKA
ncbi:MAG: glycerol kinase GlpK [Spirochaetia bacterium]|jgi:glycerol kinase